jgi:hypothetical protein
MEESKMIKSTQEQAVASWVNYLNQIRVDRFMEFLQKQDANLEDAMNNIDEAFSEISKIINSNRGGRKGMHGFIAEVAEVGVENARRNINGETANYSWVNDNGATDIIRDGVNIQQKFYQNGLSLGAISNHLGKYPDYIKNGGKYQIPKDQYEKIKELLLISEEQANKMPTSDGSFSLGQWRAVQEFFGDGNIDFERDVEPSALEYKDVQVGKIGETIDAEKERLENADREYRKEAYEKSKPTIQEGAKITAISAAVEGGTNFCLAIAEKIRSGKKISEFDEGDWKEIAGDSGIGVLKGGVRGTSIYLLTNYTATPASVASSLVTASFGVAEQAHLYHKGNLSELGFIENSEILCIDTAISALSSFAGQAIIPIPVIGAVIGNAVGTVMYKIAKDYLSDAEEKMMKSQLDSLAGTEVLMTMRYQKCVECISRDVERYMDILNQTYSTDTMAAFDASISMAKYIGVPMGEVLDSKQKIDEYFLT